MQFNRRIFSKRLIITGWAIIASSFISNKVYSKTNYKVKPGDTLSKIAKNNGTSVYKIKKINKLENDLIIVGQNLTLPDPTNFSYRDPIKHIKYQNKNVNVDRNKWECVIVHHSATTRGNASIFDSAHRNRGMKNGLAYHFVIGNGSDTRDGQIEMGNRWLKQINGGHVKNSYINEVGIGICLVGNFEQQKPSQAQIKSLIKLIDWLKSSAIKKDLRFAGHKDIEKNLCPGKNFPLQSFHKKYSV